METEAIADFSDAIEAVTSAVNSELLAHERGFELVNRLVIKIEEHLDRP